MAGDEVDAATSGVAAVKPPKGSLLDLGPRTRIAFAAAFVALQATLILTGAKRPDRIFAFQMFNESSTIEIHVSRRVRAGSATRLVPLEKGAWSGRDASGAPKKMRWRDEVRDPILSRLDARVAASYGVEAQLFRLQAALDHVAKVDADPSLVAFVADVSIRRNGRPPEPVRLESAPR